MLNNLMARNRIWSANRQAQEPDYFTRLAALQAPEYFWIGCSDSRVPANVVAGLDPGEVFVHRNVANIIHSSDMNLLSSLEFAVEALKVREIIVCGHYGCGGVKAAMEGASLGLIDNWLRHIQDVRDRHQEFLDALPDDEARWQALCELNVVEQVRNIARTTLVRDAWKRRASLTLHGWIYGLADGRLHDLRASVAEGSELHATFTQAVAAVRARHG